jgi:hypothetical protein
MLKRLFDSKNCFFVSVRCFFVLIFYFFVSLGAYSQSISESQRNDIVKELNKQITTLSAFSSEKPEMLSVYKYQLQTANNTLAKYDTYKIDNQIYSKWFELKTLCRQNEELITFLEPRVGSYLYRKAVAASLSGDKRTSYALLQKALAYDSNNVMVNYELSKISLDSMQIVKATARLTHIISAMNPNEEEKLLCQNLIAFSYDKNLLKSMALIREQKYAYAVDILNELKAFCEKDIYNICNGSLVDKELSICQNGIYKDHVKITQKAIDMGRDDVAGDFVENTYEYFQKNRALITDTTSFEGLVENVTVVYISQIKQMNAPSQSEARFDLIRKTKELLVMVGGEKEAKYLQQLALLQGTKTPVDMHLDSIESAAKNTGYVLKYPQYIKDSIQISDSTLSKIEKDYVPSSSNKIPEHSLANESTKTKTMNSQIDAKFFESRTFMTVNNYDKALEVLEKANRLAKIDADKQEVEKMYVAAIREITARRMSAAEYLIFQGDVKKADSLVALTNDLITAYKMDKDDRVVQIMNSYLKALDKKVCQKKQDEVDGFVFNIIESIKKQDFYKADDLITLAMQVKGSNDCYLDKTKVRQLKRQIEKPLEYVQKKEETMALLDTKDTMQFITSYARLQQFYDDNSLGEVNVDHKPLRRYLSEFGNDDMIIRSIEEMIKYRLYFPALEGLGALKDMGYSRRQTKNAQKKIGKMMSLDLVKRQDKIHESNLVDDRYKGDKWFKYFYKEYKKYLIKWSKEE